MNWVSEFLVNSLQETKKKKNSQWREKNSLRNKRERERERERVFSLCVSKRERRRGEKERGKRKKMRELKPWAPI
ncbi:MAG: hypothetical protein N7Q72_03315, partial [Spiroplasma sp. Tabriz.8]|nr:hypothetical protein [Spiroplasma sp. Tabriz.8]